MVRHERRTGAFVSALFLTLFALCMEFVPSTMTASAKSVLSGPATVACSRVRFIGVRGSGDPPQGKPDKNDKFQSMGEAVYRTYQSFSGQMQKKGIDVSGEGLNYEAVPIQETWNMKASMAGEVKELIQEIRRMKASVDGGVETLSNILKANRDCVVLAGYSQGAWVLHDTLDKLPSAAQGKIKAVLAFGDPHFDPQARGSILIGSSNKLDLLHDGGAIGKKSFPSWVFGVQDYCKRYDPICTSVLRGFGVCTEKGNPCAHFDYNTDQALQERAASWLASLFANLISSAYNAPPTSPRLVTCSDHMTAPWVALYDGLNYQGQSLCFEGRGRIDLRDYRFAREVGSVNIAANVTFQDDFGNHISYGYGYQTGNLGAWGGRITSFSIES